MSTSILATICAERLTKILVRYSRAPQSQCPVQNLNPLPRTETSAAYLKPLTSAGQSQSPAKWQPIASFSSLGQRFQAELPLLRPKTEPPQRNFTQSTPNTPKGFQDWKQLGSTRYSAPFASIFQSQSVPMKPFSQDSRAFHADKLYRDCY